MRTVTSSSTQSMPRSDASRNRPCDRVDVGQRTTSPHPLRTPVHSNRDRTPPRPTVISWRRKPSTPRTNAPSPIDALRRHGVVSVDGSGGKPAFRLYPPWVTTTNRQAGRSDGCISALSRLVRAWRLIKRSIHCPLPGYASAMERQADLLSCSCRCDHDCGERHAGSPERSAGRPICGPRRLRGVT